MKVKFVDFPQSYRKIRKEVLKEIDRVLSAGDLILRDDVEKFEKNLAKIAGAKYAVGVNSGTDALFLSLKALGIGKGDEVITSGYTFWATVEAIINCGATPVLADIKNDLLIDPGEVEKLITKKTKAIIPVHIGGNICNMDEIMKIAERNKLFVVEDSAQAIRASKLRGDTACYSFYPAKVLGCYGDGGGVATNNKEIAEKIKLLRHHGGKPHPQCSGYNSRLDNLQAAILNVRAKGLRGLIARRKAIAKIYDKELAKLNNDSLVLPRSITYQEYNVAVLCRDKLFEFLKENGIETIKGDYSFPMKQPPMASLANEVIIRLPIWPDLTDKQIKYVCETIKSFYAN